jgi:uridine kinase
MSAASVSYSTKLRCVSFHHCRSFAGTEVDLKDISYAEGVRFSSKPACLLGTRNAVLEKISSFLSGTTHDDQSQILLLTGVAGSGKSAIASTIAERFEKRHRLGSSFFFNHAEAGKNRADNVFSTIARDLADLDCKIKNNLWNAIKDNISLRKTRSPREQFEHFIQNPTKDLTILGSVVIVIDALDECGTQTSRKELLDVLVEKIPELPANVRILITARPVTDIVDRLSSLTSVRHMRMEDIPGTSTKADIRTFIQKELSNDAQGLGKSLDEQALDALVEMAGVLFIWASTACRFIKGEGEDGGGRSPAERLQLVISNKLQTRKLDRIDNLYLKVLGSALSGNDTLAMRRFKSVMGAILAAKERLSVAALHDLFEEADITPRVDPRSIVPYLGTLLTGTTKQSVPVQVLHPSFKDFLTDRSRSGAFFIDIKEHNDSLAVLSLDLMKRHLKRDICGFGDLFLPNSKMEDIPSRTMKWEGLQYACRFWVDHLVAVETEVQTNPLLGRIHHFLCHHVLHWIEVLGLTNQLEAAIECLERLEEWLKVI